MYGAPEAAPRYRVGSSHSGDQLHRRVRHRRWRLNGPLARCVGVRALAIGRLPVVAAAAGGGGLICRRRGRVGRGLGRLGCRYNDRIAQVPAACWMPVLYLGARVYVVHIGPMQRTLTR